MIELDKTIIKNFLTIGKNGLELDFMPGITTIHGLNGNGKSSIFEAIYFAFTGKSYRGAKKKSLVNRTNKKDLEDKIVLKKNGKKYEICRRIKPIGDKEDEYILVDGEKIDIVDKKNFQKEVEKILGFDEKTLNQVVFLGQGFYVPFVDLNLNDKRKFISKVFGLDKFKDMEVNLKNDVAELKKNKEVISEKINGLEKTIKYAEIKQQEDINRLNERIDTELERIRDNEDKIFINRNMILEVDKENLIKKEKQLLEFKYKKQKYQDEFEALNRKLEEAEQNKSSIDNISKLIEEKEERIAIHKKSLNIEKIKDKVCTFDNHSKFIKNFTKAIEVINNKLNDTINKIRYVTNTIKVEIDKLNYYKKTAICGECESELSEEFRKSKIDILLKSINENHKTNKKLYSEKDNLLSKRNKLSEKINFINNVIDDIINEMDELEILKKEYINLNIGDIDELKKQITMVLNEETLINMKIKNLDNEIKDDREKDERNNKLMNEISIFGAAIKIIRKNIDEWKTDLDRITNSTDITNFKTELEELQNKLKKMNIKHEYMNKIIGMIGDKGIKKYIVDQYVPTLNQYIQKYSKMLNFEDTIVLSEGGMKVETFNRNTEKEIELYSSGERQKINISILFAFLSLMRAKSGIEIPLLVLDEITSPLDIENVTLFYKILKEEFKDMCVMVISHKLLENNLDLIDRTIKVDKNIRGFSEYSIDNKN